jgi:hypothetical protein
VSVRGGVGVLVVGVGVGVGGGCWRWWRRGCRWVLVLVVMALAERVWVAEVASKVASKVTSKGVRQGGKILPAVCSSVLLVRNSKEYLKKYHRRTPCMPAPSCYSEVDVLLVSGDVAKVMSKVVSKVVSKGVRQGGKILPATCSSVLLVRNSNEYNKKIHRRTLYACSFVLS